MYRKVLMAVLLLTTALCVTACGKETAIVADAPVESTESQPAETEELDSTEDELQPAEIGEQDLTEDKSQPVEEEVEEEKEKETSYIFSDMPVAAYEVTGLGIGRFESVYEGEYPLIRLTPGENTFVLFCMEGNDAGEYSVSEAAIHSPSGNSKWEAVTYTCLDALIDPVPEGCSILTRQETGNYVYNEETYDGGFFSLVDPWLDWLRFAEIYHPDAPQNDAIYVIDAAPSVYEQEYNKIDEVLTEMENAFDILGGTLKEIPVEEALERYNIVVSR